MFSHYINSVDHPICLMIHNQIVGNIWNLNASHFVPRPIPSFSMLHTEMGLGTRLSALSYPRGSRCYDISVLSLTEPQQSIGTAESATQPRCVLPLPSPLGPREAPDSRHHHCWAIQKPGTQRRAPVESDVLPSPRYHAVLWSLPQQEDWHCTRCESPFVLYVFVCGLHIRLILRPCTSPLNQYMYMYLT